MLQRLKRMQWKRLKICEWEELCERVSKIEGKVDVLIAVNCVLIGVLVVIHFL
jgi:hypothetical protein